MLRALLHKLRRAGIDVQSAHRRHAANPLAVIQRVFSGQDVKVLFDCGAHHGRVTREFKDLFPAAKVFAFEPTPETYSIARDNLSGINGVEVVNAAVGENSGVVNFYTLPHTESNSMLKRSDDAQCIEVKVYALGDFCRERGIEHIELLKMDIEGLELPALRGIEPMLAAQEIDLIYSEVRFEPLAPGSTDFLALAGFLREKGYHVYGFYDTIFSPNLQFDRGDLIFVSDRVWQRLGAFDRMVP